MALAVCWTDDGMTPLALGAVDISMPSIRFIDFPFVRGW